MAPLSDPSEWIDPLAGDVVAPPPPPVSTTPDRFPRMALMEQVPTMEATPGGAWVVESDGIVRAFYDVEIDALRQAVANQCKVRFVAFGEEL